MAKRKSRKVRDLEFTIEPLQPEDLEPVQSLHEKAFGPGRFARTAYRVREGGDSATGLCFVAKDKRRFAGVIHFTEISIGDSAGRALLLGPLAIDDAYRDRKCGRQLIANRLAWARENGFALVVLIGDLSYYKRTGFISIPKGQITLPGPVDPARLLAHELVDGAVEDFHGLIRVL